MSTPWNERPERSYDTDRVLTVPNLLSLLRLLGVPVFLWLVLGARADAWAVLLLVVAGLTDWLDGKLARAWHQTSRLGQMLDPAADRLYIASTLVALAIRGLVPWWLVALLVARDLLMVALVPLLKRCGCTSLPVHLVGKMATCCLLYAFPMVLLGDGVSAFAQLARILGWAFAIWGTALYWWGGLLYLRQSLHLVQATTAARELR